MMRRRKLSRLCKCCGVINSSTGQSELNSNPSTAKVAERPLNTPEFTHSVFGNELIFDRIIEHLGIPDLKILRQACKFLMTKVNASRRFISNVRVTVTDESIAENGLGDTLEWENARIFFNQTSAKHFTKIQNQCHRIQDLQLIHNYVYSEHRIMAQQQEKESHLACHELLEFPHFANLRSLSLDLNLLRRCIQIPALEKIVSGLKNLHLTFSNLFHREHPWVVKNLEIIAGLEWRLDSFSITIGNDWISNLLPPAYCVSYPIGSILTSSTNTLMTIVVNCNVAFGVIRQIQGVRFPRLRNIEFQVEGLENEEAFLEFLRLHPELESVHICGSFNEAIMDVISNTPNLVLHTLRLQCASIYFPNLNELILMLPASLRGVEISVPYFQPQRGERSLPGPTTAAIIAFTRFPDLVELKLPHNIFVTDDLLQIICRSMTRLQVFHFGSNELTDFGLTGERDNYSSGVSLRNLKGLRQLRIGNCVGITERGLAKSVKFLELRNAELMFNISDPVLLEIASNNPSLEFVARCLHRPWRPFQPALDKYHRALFSRILVVNPRLTRIKTCFGTGEQNRILTGVDRPSYGVCADLSNEATVSRARQAMKLANDSSGKGWFYYL